MMAPNIWDGDAGMYRCADGGILKLMADEVEACNKARGWYDNERTFGDEIALLHSEVSEALEEYRRHGAQRYVVHGMPYGEVAYLKEGDEYPFTTTHEHGKQELRLMKPEGVPSELADVLIRLLDTARRHGVDLFAEYRAKMDFNWGREYRHGGKAL